MQKPVIERVLKTLTSLFYNNGVRQIIAGKNGIATIGFQPLNVQRDGLDEGTS